MNYHSAITKDLMQYFMFGFFDPIISKNFNATKNKRVISKIFKKLGEMEK